MDPSTLPSMVRSSLLMMRPSTRSAFPTQAATRRSVKVVSSAIRHYLSAPRLDTDRTSAQDPRSMRRALVGLVLVVTVASNGALVRGQGARAAHPASLQRTFSPAA